MKAAVLHQIGAGLRIDDLPIPAVGPDDVLLKVAAAGICHTDLGIIDGHVPIGRLPMIPGHEVAGKVVEVGQRVSRRLVGQRACVSYGLVCGECPQCVAGNDTLCANWKTMGRTVNGGFAEYMVAPAANIVPIPDNLGYEEAAIIPCSVATAYHAVHRAGTGAGQRVAIFGIGGIGLNAVQFASLTGTEVIAVDMSDRKLELARSLGARHGINAKSTDVVAAIRQLTGDLGVDATLECIGSPSTYQTCIDSVKRGGRVVVVGFHPDPLKVNPLRLMLDEVTITGAHVANRREITEIVRLLSDRRIDIRRMVTHTFDFRDIRHGLERLRTQEGDPIRIVVRFPASETPGRQEPLHA